MEPEVMYPLYPPSGAPCRGYVCNVNMITVDKTILFCRSVTRTKRGMWTHLRIVHGIRKQTKLEFEEKKAAMA